MIKIIRHFHQLDLQRIKIIPSVGKVMGKWSSHIEGHVNLTAFLNSIWQYVSKALKMFTSFDLVILAFRNVAFVLFHFFHKSVLQKENFTRGLKILVHTISRYNKLSDRHA